MNALRRLARQQEKKKKADAIALLQKLPKPPKENGVCACGCCHRGDNDHGPCPEFVGGSGGGRCAICDHGLTCHRRKGEPPPQDWNVPIKLNEKHRSLYPPRVHAMLRGEFVCIRCHQPAPFIERMKTQDPKTGKVVNDLCPRCFEDLTVIDEGPVEISEAEWEKIRGVLGASPGNEGKPDAT